MLTATRKPSWRDTAVDAGLKRIERKARPMYWCQTCELGLYQHEADMVPVSKPYEFWGERGTYNTVEAKCGACGEDVEDYAGQGTICEDCE